MQQPRYTTEQLQEAVQASTSMRPVLAKLGVAPYGGNYDVLRAKLQRLGPETSHSLGRAWNRNRRLSPRIPLRQYPQATRPFSAASSRTAFNQGVSAPVCGSCGLQRWLDQPIPLELDHVDGNNQDNRLKNLRLVSPNCHVPLRRSGVRDAAQGLARDCSHRGTRWCCSPEFDPIHAGRFRAGCSNCLSPLRLPISPPGHTGAAALYATVSRTGAASAAMECSTGGGIRQNGPSLTLTADAAMVALSL